jgi:hypothetical protein
MRGEPIDEERLVRLTGVLSRTLTALRVRKPEPSPGAPHRETLQEHLQRIAAQRSPAEKPPVGG